MGKVRLPKPTPLGWCAAAGIAAVAGTIMYLALHNAILAGVVGVLGALAFVLAGPPPESAAARSASSASSAPSVEPALTAEPVRATVPAQRVEAAPAPQPVAVAAPAPSPLTDPLDQVSLLSAYLQEETDGYQPSYAPEAPTLVARVPGQTLTVTEPDPLANAFTSPPAEVATEPSAEPPAVGSWRMGIDILPQSRSSAAAVGNRLGSFRSAVVKARKEAKPKPSAGKHRAG
jgi:hypothetical protein